jgi:chromosome segregation ATPase
MSSEDIHNSYGGLVEKIKSELEEITGRINILKKEKSRVKTQLADLEEAVNNSEEVEPDKEDEISDNEMMRRKERLQDIEESKQEISTIENKISELKEDRRFIEKELDEYTTDSSN